jgi:hypothetical protein
MKSFVNCKARLVDYSSRSSLRMLDDAPMTTTLQRVVRYSCDDGLGPADVEEP